LGTAGAYSALLYPEALPDVVPSHLQLRLRATSLSSDLHLLMKLPTLLLTATALCLAVSPVYSQSLSPGFRIAGSNGSSTVQMLDNTGAVVHTWSTGFNPGLGLEMQEDGKLLRAIRTGGVPGLGGGSGGGVQQLALDGTVLWDFRYNSGGKFSHHDIETLPNGNVLMIAWEDKTLAQALAAGRSPSLINGNVMRPDHIIEVQPTGPTTGTIVWEWHVWDHLIQEAEPTQSNFGVVGDHPELVDVNYPPAANEASDWNHMNSIEYDPIHDLIMVSARHQDEIWIIDHSTTTAEAAGHTGGARGQGGDLLYRWGNPAAYNSGTFADKQLFGQHGAQFVPPGYPGAGNVTLFNNSPPGGSQAMELVLPQDAQGDFTFGPGGVYGPAGPTWTYSGGFNSNILSSVLRLPNGNTLICSGTQALILEVTNAGQVLFSEDLGNNVFHARYTERTFWADEQTISASSGGSVAFDLIAGTAQAGQGYLVLGSLSGTTPGFTKSFINVPLNWDIYTELTLNFANTPTFANTMGTLDGSGHSSASLNVNPGEIPPAAVGAVLYHAFVALDPGTSHLTWASNSIGITIVP